MARWLNQIIMLKYLPLKKHPSVVLTPHRHINSHGKSEFDYRGFVCALWMMKYCVSELSVMGTSHGSDNLLNVSPPFTLHCLADTACRSKNSVTNTYCVVTREALPCHVSPKRPLPWCWYLLHTCLSLRAISKGQTVSNLEPNLSQMNLTHAFNIVFFFYNGIKSRFVAKCTCKKFALKWLSCRRRAAASFSGDKQIWNL